MKNVVSRRVTNISCSGYVRVLVINNLNIFSKLTNTKYMFSILFHFFYSKPLYRVESRCRV